MIDIRHLSRRFGDRVPLRDIDLEIEKGETLSVLGPSGAGKTTLLRCIAGLDRGYSGEIVLDGVPAKSYFKTRRPAMVFQHYANFHWMTVRQNLMEALRSSGRLFGASADRSVDEMLNAVGLGHASNQYVATLSGGMQQRVALARVLLQQSDIVLLDEPFGALDIGTRANLQDFTKRLFREGEKTVVFVTHDPSEAVYISDRVFVCSAGPVDCVQIFRSPFGRVEDQGVKISSEFLKIQQEIVDLLKFQ